MIYTYFLIKKIRKFNVLINIPNQLNQIIIFFKSFFCSKYVSIYFVMSVFVITCEVMA
jgi:hypothetical protein